MTIVIFYWENLPGTIALKKWLLRTNLLAAASLILLSCFALAFAQADWALLVNGAVTNSLNLTMDQLMAMPKTTVEAALYCEGVFLISGNWTGVKLSEILQTAGLNPQAESVAFTATDGYSVTIPLTDVMNDNVIIAYSFNNQPLSEGTRLVLPGANGASWIAMIAAITVTTSASDHPAGISAGPDINKFNSAMPDQSQSLDTPTPVPSLAPTPTPTPSNQTATSVSTSPKEPESQLEEDSPTSNNWEEYAYLITFAVILVAATTMIMGYLARKRKMRTKI
jgi:DMSO/TMAO reductase YedYZ molybdopterin-dependent catalytic subunit